MKQEIINKLLDLYKATPRTDKDKSNFEDVARHISQMHDTAGVVNSLDMYERYLIEVLDALPVSKLAELCGVSRMQMYRLLKTKSKLRIYKNTKCYKGVTF